MERAGRSISVISFFFCRPGRLTIGSVFPTLSLSSGAGKVGEGSVADGRSVLRRSSLCFFFCACTLQGLLRSTSTQGATPPCVHDACFCDFVRLLGAVGCGAECGVEDGRATHGVSTGSGTRGGGGLFAYRPEACCRLLIDCRRNARALNR